MIIEGNPIQKEAMDAVSQRRPNRGAKTSGRIRRHIPPGVSGERSLPLPESLPLSRQLQGMCGYPPAHQEHVPNCMRPLINKKLKSLSELTEHNHRQ